MVPPQHSLNVCSRDKKNFTLVQSHTKCSFHDSHVQNSAESPRSPRLRRVTMPCATLSLMPPLRIASNVCLSPPSAHKLDSEQDQIRKARPILPRLTFAVVGISPFPRPPIAARRFGWPGIRPPGGSFARTPAWPPRRVDAPPGKTKVPRVKRQTIPFRHA